MWIGRIGLAISLAVLSGAAALPATATTSTRATALLATATTLTLGTALPDTGSLKAYGPGTQAAVRLAVEDANAAGGVMGSPITLMPGDSGGTGSTTFARTLTRLSGAQVIIGPLSSSLALDNSQLLRGRTIVSPAVTSALLTGRLARVVPAEPLQGAMLVSLAQRRGAVRIVVVAPRSQQALVDAALDRAGDLGLQASSVVYSQRQTATNIATRIVRSSADALLLASSAETTGILSALLPRGMPATVLLTQGAADSIDPRQLRRGTLDGAQSIELDLRVPRSLAARIREAAPRARELAYSPQAYDAAAVAILAAEQAGRSLGEITAEGVRAALPAVTSVGIACDSLARCLRLLRQGEDIDYVGYSGPFDLSRDGDPQAARYLVRIYTDANRPGSTARPVRYP